MSAGRETFLQDILQHGLVEAELRHQPFQLSILLGQLLELADLACLQLGILLLQR